jgi:nucleotide-binding universal stress UspA family protein
MTMRLTFDSETDPAARPTIVVLLDGSPRRDQSALNQAQALAAQARHLLLVEVVHDQVGSDPAHSRVVAAAAQQYLAEVATHAGLRGKNVETTVFFGDTAGAVAHANLLRKADLFIMAVAGRHGLRHRILGCAVEQVLARTPVPVCVVKPPVDAVVQPRRRNAPPRLLVPLDGSPAAETALVAATNLASALGADIILLQAVPIVDYLSPPGAVAWGVCALDTMRVDAATYLRQVAEHLARRTSATIGQPVVRLGQPAKAIIDAIDEYAITLVVMATHAHIRLRRLVLGSVTDRVLDQIRTPLVLVRTAGSASG